MINKCPKCGRFLANVIATCDQDDNIHVVTGLCAKHGEVHPTDWEWDDFFWEIKE